MRTVDRRNAGILAGRGNGDGGNKIPDNPYTVFVDRQKEKERI
jgi:hypothetical protein